MTYEAEMASQARRRLREAVPSTKAQEALKRISEARTRMLLTDTMAFFGHLSLHLEIRISADPAMTTAATDGRSIWVDQSFLEELDEDGLQFILAHETMHVALRHTRRGRLGSRMKALNPELANIAADYVVNGILKDCGFRPLPESLIDKSFHGLATEIVYYRLLGEDPGSRQQEGQVIDDHDDWDTNGSEQEGDEQDELWLRRISGALAACRGHAPASLQIHLRRLMHPNLPWRQILKTNAMAATAADYRWHPGNRRHVWRGWHLPAVWPLPRLEADVYVDVSGSIGIDHELPEFLAGLEEMCAAFPTWTLRISQFNSEIVTTRIFSEQDVLNWVDWFNSGGGTDFQCCIDDVLKQPRIPHQVIIFTDGEAPMPIVPSSLNLVWILSSAGAVESAFTHGIVARLPRNPS